MTQIDFDQFHLYDPITEKGDKLSPQWRDSFALLFEVLTYFISANGVRVAQLTTTQRDNLDLVVNGMMIYNTTTDKLQVREGGAWVNVV